MTKTKIAKRIKELLQAINSGMFSEEQKKKMIAEVEDLKDLEFNWNRRKVT